MTMSQHKYVSIIPNLGGGSRSSSMSTSSESDELLSIGARGKKRRLDHLTWEEKVQRK